MIGGAVVVALLFGVVNTMTIAARERVRTMGILKALGFSDAVADAALPPGGAAARGARRAGSASCSPGACRGTFQQVFAQFVPQYFVGDRDDGARAGSSAWASRCSPG